MKRTRFVGIASAFALLVAALIISIPGAHRGAAQGNSSTFTGAWQVTITLEGGKPFGGLATYADDGTVHGTILPVIAGKDGVTFSSAGIGVIESTGSDEAKIKIVYLLASADGTYLGQSIVTATLTMNADGNSFDGVTERQLTDPSGAVVMTSEGKAKGMRVTL